MKFKRKDVSIMKETILKEFLEIKAKVDALVLTLQSEGTSTTASITEVRKIAVLEEISRLGGSATPLEISSIAKKYGKTPSSTAGYYSGKAPSLIAIDICGKSIRKLTPQGEKLVELYHSKWGEKWIERIPLEIVGNPNTRTSEIAFKEPTNE